MTTVDAWGSGRPSEDTTWVLLLLVGCSIFVGLRRLLRGLLVPLTDMGCLVRSTGDLGAVLGLPRDGIGPGTDPPLPVATAF